jgi:acetyltransferase-like isoleucine patch superfamily enzyme
MIFAEPNMHSLFMKLLNAAATRLKGEPYRVDPDLPLSALLGYVMARAAGMARCLLRGVVLSWDPRRLVCLGSGVVLSNRRGIRFGRGVTLGRGVMIDGLAREGVVLGDGCTIGPYGMVRATGVLSQLGKGFRMGRHSSMDAYAFVGASGGVTVGNNVIMGQKVSFHAEEHVFDDLQLPIRHQGVRQRGIVIEDDCWVGSNVIFLDGAHVEPGCVIGAGSIVKGRIPANSVVVGNPARVIRPRGQRRGMAPTNSPAVDRGSPQ